jgi:uncharacterized protein YcsI (UPF0317 family)
MAMTGTTTAPTLPGQARELFRSGVSCPTSGWAPGHTQTNLIAVPRDWAYDVLLFCQRNPKPCPVLDVGDVGTTGTPLAPGTDIRTDLPRYRVWRDGEVVDEPTDATPYWRDDLVAFHIGCSFTFESALVETGIPLRHVEQGANVSMYVTRRACRPAGRLSGPMVVSMRPIPAEMVAAAVAISGRMPAVHGAPVHAGDPGSLLLGSLERPEYGDPVALHDGDVPVFWACGVTPQAALAASRVPFAITHAPGHMLITDRRDQDYVLGNDVAGGVAG